MKQDLKPMAGKSYWRSLDQKADDPEFRKFVESEFPEGTFDLARGISRKKFLSLMGASMALAGLAGCRRPVEKIIPYAIAPEEIVPGVPRYFATTMPFGLNAFGLLVESHEGRPTKIEGNKEHPSSLGASNAFVQAEILNLYDPDRSKFVRHNGEQSSWPEFVVNWKNEREKYLKSKGEGLAVLSVEFASPTLARLRSEFLSAFPKAKWVTHAPVSDEMIYDGLKLAAGKYAHPVPALEKARVILTLDADFMKTGSNDIVNSRGFADSRRVKSENDTMSRLYAVESGFSLTGAMADHRLPLQSRLMSKFTAALALELRSRGVEIPGLKALTKKSTEGFDQKWLSALATDLITHRGYGLILAGPGQPPELHALVFALNDALGNIGRTIRYYEIEDAVLSSVPDLQDLVERMNSGAVSTLLLLGGNPVYDAPADLDFSRALQNVPNSIQVANHPDETSTRVNWHIPKAHFLEQWGDARALDGTASVIQPLIAPLFGAKSDVEVLSAFLSGEDRPGYDLVRETWSHILKQKDFDKRWQTVLHDGLLPDSAARVIQLKISANSLQKALSSLVIAEKEETELIFSPSPAVFDGRYANNGWLQENPHPITKLTWDNAAVIGTATARRMQVQNHDVIQVKTESASLQLPVWIVPGIAENTICIDLGYGRKFPGRIGGGLGRNAYALRTTASLGFATGVKISKTGRKYRLVSTQDHHGLDVEKLASDEIEKRLPVLIREATLEEYHEEPEFAKEMVEHPPLKSLWEDRKYDEGYQWGMTIDLNVCNGCNACTIACQSENNIPIVGKKEVGHGREMHWIRIDRYFSGEEENPEMVFQPIACAQCENAPCEQVCPVAATNHDAEGLNTMAYNRCIGTRYCANNCPYKVRRFNFFNFTKELPEIVQMAMNPDVTVRFRGVMEKCTFCVQRIHRSKLDAKNSHRQLRDGDIQTACEQTCPTDAIVFGDINDVNSRVSQIKKQDRDYALLGELNIKPRTTYQAKLRNPNPELT
ncbi:MAG: TAT-variant-translocated molybdopterin oxidoreductase [FCB group bacterium]|nr:TAT-variant-translocated molybdopterin oxidoreductase [FCB group bacterium]